MNPELLALGWNQKFADAWQDVGEDHCVPGRVIADHGYAYKVAMPNEISAETSGRLQYLLDLTETPKVGDWVSVQLLEEGNGLIHGVLPRKSEISRKRAGERYDKQVLATNVDLAFLVQALDHDFSPERLHRYIFQLQKEGITPVVILNKADKAEAVDELVDKLKSFECEILVTSATENTGIDAVLSMLKPGITAVFLGSSGVGKSTLTNLLLGEQRQATQAIREADSKGRHTTTHRELFVLPGGGLVIDTPGIRELQLWGSEDDLVVAFPAIEALVRQCKFSNCTHTTEEDCALLDAQRNGTIDATELEAYFKFQKELRFLNSKVDTDAANARKRSLKKGQRSYNQIVRSKKKRRK